MATFGKIKLPEGEGGLYLRLQDGDTVRIRVTGEPRIHIDNFGNTRFASVVYNYTAEKAQVYSYGKSILRQFQELEADEDWGDLTKYDVKVSRKGSGQMDTEYSVNPSPNKEPLTSAQKDAIAEVDLKTVIPTSIALDDFAEGKQPQAKEKEVVLEDIEEKINLDEIPF